MKLQDIKRVDKLGRVVLPIDFRKQLGLQDGAIVTVELNDNSLILKPCDITCNYEKLLRDCTISLYGTDYEDILFSEELILEFQNIISNFICNKIGINPNRNSEISEINQILDFFVKNSSYLREKYQGMQYQYLIKESAFEIKFKEKIYVLYLKYDQGKTLLNLKSGDKSIYTLEFDNNMDNLIKIFDKIYKM